MGLIDEAVAESSAPNCKVAAIRAQLPKAEQGELDELLGRHDISSPTIVKILAKRSGKDGQALTVNVRTLNQHRYAQDCACHRGNLKPGRRGGGQ